MKPQLDVFSQKTFSSFYTTDDNKAYTCLCLSKSDAIERIKNAKCESSLRCLTWRKPTQEIFGKERHKPDAGKKRLVGARLNGGDACFSHW